MSENTPPAGPSEPPDPFRPPSEQPDSGAGGQGATPPPPSWSTPPPPPAGAGTPPPGFGAAPPGQPAGAGAPFTVGEAFNWGWAKFQQNAGAILVASLIYVVVIGVIYVVWFMVGSALFVHPASITVDQTTGAISSSAGSGFVMSLLFSAFSAGVFFVLLAFLQAAIIRGALAIADGARLELSSLLSTKDLGVVLGAAVIVGALSFVGVLACYVGTLVVSFFTAFYLFFVIDQHQGAWESVKSSFHMVKENASSVVMLVIGVLVAYVIGSLLCGIGLIVTVPVSLLAMTYAYRRLQGQPVAP